MRYSPIIIIILLQYILIGQTRIQIFDLDTDKPIYNAKVYIIDQNLLLGETDKKGFLYLNYEKNDYGEDNLKNEDENSTKDVYITADNYIPRYEVIGKFDKIIYMESEKNFRNDKSNAENLVREILEKDRNNNPHSLGNYQFKSYSKFGLDVDKASLEYIEKPKKNKDFLNNNIKRIVSRNLLFFAERTISHNYDKKWGEKNLITSSTLSGIDKPIYDALARGLINNKLPEPFQERQLKFYRFKITDTVTIKNRKTYEITFYLIKRYNKIKSSNGVAYIDAENFALAKYVGVIKDKFTSYYNIERIPKKGIWFTSLEYIRIQFPSIKILNKKNPGAKSWITLKTVYSDFKTDMEFQKSDFFGYEYELEKDFWNNEERLSLNRTSALIKREKLTYSTIDSISGKYNITNKLYILSSIARGELKFNKINFDLFNSLRFNDYEGFRFQAGGRTNYNFSEDFALKVYGAWATKDMDFKAGAGIDFYINKINNGKLSFFGESDVQAAGKNRVREYGAIENVRDQTNNLSNNIYYSYRKGLVEYKQDFFDMFTATTITDYKTQKSEFEYSYRDNNPWKWYNEFTTSVRIKFTPFTDYMKTPIDKIIIKDRLPYFFFNYTKSWKVFSSDFSYHKFDFTSFINWKNDWGETKMTTNAGYISGNTTLMNLYESFGVVKNGTSVFNRFELRGYNTFETMTPGTYFTNRYVAFFLSHTFKDLRIYRNKNLYITIVYNGMIGDLGDRNYHTKHDFTVPEKYYQEAGIEFNNLISIFGFGAYYRFGTYNKGNFDDNLYFKLTYTLF